MFLKQVKAEALVKKDLAVGRGLEITGFCAGVRTKLTGIVDFISHSEKTNVSNIFINNTRAQRMVMKVYSDRNMAELFLYEEDSIKFHIIQHVTVTVDGGNFLLDFKDGLKYNAKEGGYKWVPVVVGDTVRQASRGINHTVLALSSSGQTMFIEDEYGNAKSVSYKDETFWQTFAAFKWE